jgi:hypothetical protein
MKKAITHGKEPRVDESETQADGTGDPAPMRGTNDPSRKMPAEGEKPSPDRR